MIAAGVHRACSIATSMIFLAASVSCAGKAIVSAPTGPPDLLAYRHGPLTPMDRAGYQAEIQRLASRKDLVPVREWPADLPADAPVFLADLIGSIVTLAVRGDASSGLDLLADLDANGKLDEPGIPFEKGDDGWIARFQVVPAAASTGSDGRAPTWIEARWQQMPSFEKEGEQSWSLLICKSNVRRGVVDLAGRQTAFAITGEGGAYGGESLEVFFDLDGDGRLALDSRYSTERFTVNEERVVVGHTAYRFTIDPRGVAVTLTRLEGKFERRTNLDVGARAPEFTLTDLEGRERRLSDFRGSVVLLDFWSTGCAPCIWELPELAALRTKYHDRRFEILGVHVGPQDPAEIATLCASKGAGWPQVVDAANKVAARYRVDRYPTTFLLDRKGRILDHDVRGAKLEAAVQRALGRFH